MATPETHSVELDPFPPSCDGRVEVVESELNQIVEAETRELPAYSSDGDDKTLVGIGSSGKVNSNSANSSAVQRFESSDRTLVGIGPAERAKQAKLAELASRSQQAAAPAQSAVPHSEPPGSVAMAHSEPPESVAMPHSEPGPFVASNHDDETPERLPMKKGDSWLLALSALLVAAAAFALLRGVAPYNTSPRLRSAGTVVSPPALNEARTRLAQFEPAFASPADTSVQHASAGLRSTQAADGTQAAAAAPAAMPSATAQRESQSEVAPRHVNTTSASPAPLGALAITSNSPSGLVLDGRPLGKAPRLIQVPSGPHTVLFIHPQRGRMSVTVNVRPGRTTTASADF